MKMLLLHISESKTMLRVTITTTFLRNKWISKEMLKILVCGQSNV